MSIDTKTIRDLHAKRGDHPWGSSFEHAAYQHMPELLDAYDRLSALEVESLRQQLAAAQAEARNWKRIAEDATHVEREELARVREIVSGMREYADSCDHPSEASKRNAVEYWLTQLEDALSPAPEPAPAPELLVIGVDLAAPGADRTVKAVIKQPPEHESLPLMARREWRESVAFATVNQGAITGVFDRYDAAARSATHHRACIYRIASHDEHGLPVVERTADMPKRAKYRISWITQADAAGGDVEYTDSLPLALEANRSGAVSERIEDYRESGQEGKE